VQDTVVEGVRRVAEFVGGVLPEDRPSLPFMDQLPSPAELVESQYSFAQKVLELNHSFAKALVDAASPIYGTSAPARPAPAKKAAA
jgi:hypothetical protein